MKDLVERIILFRVGSYDYKFTRPINGIQKDYDHALKCMNDVGYLDRHYQITQNEEGDTIYMPKTERATRPHETTQGVEEDE